MLQIPARFSELYAIKVTSLDGKPDLGGEAVSNARDDFSSEDNKPEVTMYMTGEGAAKWKKMTAEGFCALKVLLQLYWIIRSILHHQ